MAKVAVITRTKDRPQFLKRAIVSIAKQTYRDYIHVIVNDGGDRESVDDIVASLSDFQRDKTKVFHRAVSSNAPDTIFNESIDRVDSEYFAIHDDDDTWHPDFLKYTVEALDGGSELGAVVARANKVIEYMRNGTIVEKKRLPYMPNMQAISLYRQCIDNQFTPIASLFRRSAYVEVGKFDSSLPVVGDWEFGIRLLMKYDAGFINPGYALANYHHRNIGDDSFAKHDHRKYVTMIANKYLRSELREGKIGPGYIMSKLKYEDDKLKTIIKGLVPSAILSSIVHRKF